MKNPSKTTKEIFKIAFVAITSLEALYTIIGQNVLFCKMNSTKSTIKHCVIPYFLKFKVQRLSIENTIILQRIAYFLQKK